MKYILMMSGKKSDFEGYARWSRQELEANLAFMRAFSKGLKDSGAFVALRRFAEYCRHWY